MNFIPHTQADVEAMLEVIGVPGIDDLFADIPPPLRLKRPLDLPEPLSEQGLAAVLGTLGKENRIPDICLTGAGAYHHYVPAVVRHLTGRSEFYTAYTPYQAEISQGILQAIYEYQTMILHLTGMEITNASMYDGASAAAEACLMAASIRPRTKIIVSRAVHPEYRDVLHTYARARGYEILETPYGADGRTEITTLTSQIGHDTIAVVVQTPNFFGIIEDLAALITVTHAQEALFCSLFTEALSLGLLTPPGRFGADIVAGEGQSFGLPMNFGGPYLGILAARQRFLRRMPGRIVGATKDIQGNRAFVLTLQTREQHIRREQATSNICSNETLCALAAAIYLAYMGKGLSDLASLNVRRAHHLASRLSELQGWKRMFPAPFFNEFVMEVPDPQAVQERLAEAGIMGGYVLGGTYPELTHGLLFCVTEMVTLEDMDRIVSILKGV